MLNNEKRQRTRGRNTTNCWIKILSAESENSQKKLWQFWTRKSCKNFTLPLNFRSVEHRVSFSHAKELSHWACARGHKRATILLASSTKLWHTREFIGFVFTEAWMRQRSGFTVNLHPCGPAPLPAALKAFWSNFLSVRCMNAKCLHDQIKVTGLKNKKRVRKWWKVGIRSSPREQQRW